MGDKAADGGAPQSAFVETGSPHPRPFAVLQLKEKEDSLLDDIRDHFDWIPDTILAIIVPKTSMGDVESDMDRPARRGDPKTISPGSGEACSLTRLGNWDFHA